ncbi:hypothetical protein GC169_08375 [bacterium]|nr:hypothetical protein [bacterium]
MASRLPKRRKGTGPFAVFTAFLFNLVMLTTPFIAAKATGVAFGGDASVFETNAQTLSATSQAIDSRFARLVQDAPGSAREAWGNLVSAEIDAGDITNARGLLLAAPAMLTGADASALRARLEVAGAGDDAAIEATLTYLPEAAQDAFRRLDAPMIAIAEDPGEQLTDEPSETPTGGPAMRSWTNRGASGGGLNDPSVTPVEVAEPAFSLLGDPRDLAMTAARWTRGDQIDEFAFALSGIGRTFDDPEAREGASLVLSAHRAQRLNSKFALHLSRRLFDAAPLATLSRALDQRQRSGELQTDFGYVEGGPIVEAAFRETSNRDAVALLGSDLRLISAIARDTSPSAAVSILGIVESAPDLRRARLITNAGGDRAVALARLDPEGFLDAAQRVVSWNASLRLQLLGLLACAALMVILASSVLWRSIMRSRSVRRSAVYAYQDSPTG